MEWEKIFANYLSDKGLIYKTCKELIQLNSKKKHKQKSNYKIGKLPEQTFFQGRYTNGQWVYQKVFSITNHQGNANQNHTEISPHTCCNGCYQKDKR